MIPLEKLSFSGSSAQNTIRDKRLLQIRENRKTLDNSVQSLANRITFLKNQELLTNQRIKEMRRKASDLYTKKKSIDEIRQNKRNNADANREKVESMRNKFNLQREENKKGHDNISNYLISQKRSRSDLIRLGSKRSEDYIRKRKQKELHLKSINYSLIKKKEIEGSMKVESFKNSRIDEGRKYYMNLIKREERIVDNRKNQIQKMDGFEAVLLDKINKSLKIHDQTFEELESLKTLPIAEYEQKFRVIRKNPRKKKVKTLS